MGWAWQNQLWAVQKFNLGSSVNPNVDTCFEQMNHRPAIAAAKSNQIKKFFEANRGSVSLCLCKRLVE